MEKQPYKTNLGLRLIYGKPGSGKSDFCFVRSGQTNRKRKENIYNNSRTIFIHSRKKANGYN